MADESPESQEIARPGPKPIEFGDLDKTKFVGHVKSGYGRWLALQECGFKNYRVLSRALKADPEFRAEVDLAERAIEDAARFNIYAAMVQSNGDPDLSNDFLGMRSKVRAMAQANRDRRKAEERLAKAEALEERKVAALEGAKGEGRPDLTKLTVEQLKAYAELMAIIMPAQGAGQP